MKAHIIEALVKKYVPEQTRSALEHIAQLESQLRQAQNEVRYATRAFLAAEKLGVFTSDGRLLPLQSTSSAH